MRSKKGIHVFNKSWPYICGVCGLILAIEILLQIGVRVNFIPYYYPLDNSYYSYNVIPYFTRPCCRKDSISGFRWLDNGAKAIKICQGNLVFNQLIKPNNEGFISPQAFEPHKKDPRIFRWLVFGDSFTDGYFLSQNWPQAVTNILDARKSPIEIHSFALNGSGLKTWARIFDWLNKTNYEYDGIIIACFGNDLSRDNFIMEHSGSDCFYGWADPSNALYKKQLQREPAIMTAQTEKALARILSGKSSEQPVQLLIPYYTRILYNEACRNHILKSESEKLFETYIFSSKENKTDSALSAGKYSAEKLSMIKRILEYCSRQNKKIILASIPEKKGLEISRLKKGPLIINNELDWFASKYKASVFDGYAALTKHDADDLFLKYDGHWTQEGSDEFADKISGLIIRESKIQ